MARGTLTIRMDDSELQELYALQGVLSSQAHRHVSQRETVLRAIRLMLTHTTEGDN